MKKGTYILMIILIFFFLIIATIFSFIYLEFGRPPAIRANSYLEITLQGEIRERFVPDFWTTFMGTEPLSMYDLWMNIQKAKRDPRIKCLLLRINRLSCDWAKIDELRETILNFQESGKKVYAYLDEAHDFDKEYYLATACNKIFFHPLGWLGINGLGGNILFFKKALEKMGIEVESEHVEEYKTAYNMFTEEGFTPAHKEMMVSLYENIYLNYIKTLAEKRGKTEDEVKELIDQGIFQGEEALEAGLVDGLLYEDEVEEFLQEKGKRLSKITHEKYLKINPSSLGLMKGRRIALIYGMGLIHSGESTSQTMGGTTLARWIKSARKDKSIAAIVFRVDSPGGSAIASDIIWREIKLAKKEKPVIVSMSDVAGSGGYWISMAAHKIVAQPLTLTGSIGVISGKLNMTKLYEKLGITSERLVYGKRADMYSTLRSLTPEERQLLKREIRWIYEKFLEKVSEGRNLPKEEVDRVGKGRVWTGQQAKELGLVDEIGGLQRAIELAKELAGISKEEEVKFVVWPKKVSLFSLLLGKKSPDLVTSINSRVKNIISTLQLIQKESRWAIMPFYILNR